MKTLKVFALAILTFAMVMQAHAAKDNFVYCSEASPKIFNPQLATDGPTFNATASVIYNRLVEFKNGTTDLEPGLAESWTISKDGKTYNFKLRKGVTFHTTKYFKPTRTFNADDVLWTFNRMRLTSHPYHKVNGGTYEYFRSMGMDKLLKDIKKINDYEVQFQLTRRESPFLANISKDFASILSKEYGDQLTKANNKTQIDHKPIGTGPFQYKKYVKDTVIRYTAHNTYFKGPAKSKNLIFTITPESSVRFQKLKRGECHLIAEPSPIDIELMKKHPKISVLENSGLNVGYVAFNVEKKPLNNIKVRKAISHALNREAYINSIYKGYAEVAQNPMPPTIWSYNKNVKQINYDIKKAKELLKQAGYPNGFKISLWTLPVSRPYNPNGKKLGELIQEDLKKIGIQVELKTYKWATYLEKGSKGEHEMIQLGWIGDNGDPDNFLAVLLSCDSVKAGSNYARWCNKNYSKLVSKAKTLNSKDERAKLYKEAQSIFNKELPWAPIAYAKKFRAMRADVKGYVMNPFGTESFYEVSVSK